MHSEKYVMHCMTCISQQECRNILEHVLHDVLLAARMFWYSLANNRNNRCCIVKNKVYSNKKVRQQNYKEMEKRSKMDYLLDVHTHTIASGHAYNSMMEMAKAGFDKGLKLLGITEHAPMMPGTCHAMYFHNLKVVPRTMCGIELMLGAELNILDYDGHIDLDNRVLKQLDIKIASLHSVCIQPGTKQENTRAVLGAIHNPFVDIIGHPDDGIYPLEYEPIVEAAKDTNTLLEVNNNSLNPMGARKHTRENLIAMLELCKEYEQPVIMNSDSHVFCDVARRDFSEKLIKEIDFPENLIVNRSVEVFKEYIHRKYEEK